MSETVETEMSKKPPVTEWVIASEEDFREALPKMMRFRGLIMQHLAAKMNGRNLFSAFLAGKQRHLRADSIFDAAAAMDLEVVFRPVQTKKGRQRIDAIKAQTLAVRAAKAKELAEILAEQAAEAAEDAKNAETAE